MSPSIESMPPTSLDLSTVDNIATSTGLVRKCVILVVGAVVLSLCFMVCLKLTSRNQRSQQRFFDAKMYFVAGLLYRDGLNPYNPQLERSYSKQYAGAGQLVGNAGEETFVNLPMMVPLCGLLSRFHWPFLGYALATVSVFSLVAACAVCVAMNGQSISVWQSICFAAGASIFIPSVWQTISLGQIGLPVLLAVLITLWATRTQYNLVLCLAVITTLAKVTMALPCIFVAFTYGTTRNRMSILCALVIVAALNFLVARHIGIAEVIRDYQSNTYALMHHGGVNDPDAAGRFVRLDTRPLWSAIINGSVADVVNLLMWVLIGVFAIIRMKNADQLHLTAAVAAFTLACVYHRTYDALLLLPIAWWTVQQLIHNIRATSILIACLFVVEMLCIPDHGPLSAILRAVHLTKPWWVSSLLTTTIAISLIFYPKPGVLNVETNHQKAFV